MNTTEVTGVSKNGRARSALVAAVALASTFFALQRLRAAQPSSARALDAAAATNPLGDEPARPFACGTLTCNARTSYCETINTDVPALPSNFACRPLPAACLPRADGAARDCGCFPPHTRGDYCSAPLQGGFQRFYRTSVGGH